MKRLFFLFAFVLTGTLCWSQNTSVDDLDMDEHKVVMQLTSGDTNVHKMMLRQIGNLVAAAPNTQVEVVCHANAINMLMTQQTKVQAKIIELKSKGVVFMACENTMKEKKITREEMIPEAGYVKAGLLEIIKKQEQGWSYIRSAQ
jgi:intracellular sulfur oxidation DsrE/DsrF family protein